MVLVKREKQYAQPAQGPLLKQLCEPLCISYLPPAVRLEPPSGHLSIVSFDGMPVSSNVPSERFEGFFLTCTLVGNAIEFRRRKRAYRNRLLTHIHSSEVTNILNKTPRVPRARAHARTCPRRRRRCRRRCHHRFSFMSCVTDVEQD